MNEKNKAKPPAVGGLDDIHNRCIEVGDCWEWIGYGGLTAIPTRYPAKPGRRQSRVNVWVLAWEASRGSQLSGSEVVYRKCLNVKCCNPAHLKSGTRQQMLSFLVKHGRTKQSPSSIAAITKTKRERSAKLTVEAAREIRASSESNIELAKRYGVHHSLICRIRRGEAWRESVSVSSVFSWRPAA